MKRGIMPSAGVQSGFDPAYWIEVHDYVGKMARRAFPYNSDAADDIASDCFARFLKIYGNKRLTDYQAWVGRSIAGLRKNHIREREGRISLYDPDGVEMMDRMRASSANQESVFEARAWLDEIERLPSRERRAFRILADCGDIRDIMAEMHVGPTEALYLVKSGRALLAEATGGGP